VDPAANADKAAAAAFKGDDFMLLKFRMMKRLEVTQAAVEEFKQMDGGSLPPDVKIRKQQEIRETVKALTTMWEELDALLRRETNKARSKFGQPELRARAEVRDILKDHIDSLKEDFLNAYGGGGRGGGGGSRRPLQNFAAFKAEMAEKSAASGGAAAAEQEIITGEQQQRLQQIEMRNLAEDQMIGQIHDGVERLGQMALAMNEEVTTQAGLIAALEADVEVVVEHIENINQKMKETLKQVRDSDRFCMVSSSFASVVLYEDIF
jgi:hypothetical protein